MTTGFRRTQSPKYPYAMPPSRQIGMGLVYIASGLVTVLTLGHVTTDWTMTYALAWCKKSQQLNN